MSEVTDGDRERVVEIIRQALGDEKWLPRRPYRLHVYRLAAALAEEREKARAPFLALAEEWAGRQRAVEALSGDKVRAGHWIRGDVAAFDIRRAAEES